MPINMVCLTWPVLARAGLTLLSVLPIPSPGPRLGADLSTIIEAENSGISKHIPCLDDSLLSESRPSSPESAFCLDERSKSQHHSPSHSALDLSTSRVDAEVMDALMDKDATSASEWLQSVDDIVVEEGSEDTPRPSQGASPSAGTAEVVDADMKLDFGVLDPDLSQLLSPHRLNSKLPHSGLGAKTRSFWSLARHADHTLAPSAQVVRSEHKSSASASSPRLGLVIPPSSHDVAQSSPQRRSVSLSRSTLARPSASSLPRLMRSATAAPPPTNPSPKDPSASSSLQVVQKKRHQPPSPLSSQTHSSQNPSPVNSSTTTEASAKRLAGSRLAALNRHVSGYIPNSSRTDLFPPPDNESPSSGSSRTVSDTQYLQSPRPSFELASALDVNKRRRAHLFSSRKRSLSVEEARSPPISSSSRVSPIRPSSSLSNRPPATESLGPRTVKAFAAAGLLDADRETGLTNSSARYAPSRASNDREDRYLPSRMAFSEVASTSSWGRSGSISRVMTPSEGGVTWAGSPTFSCPRTTLSGGSTAPTSVSASSSVQHATTIQLLKEKHDLETEALLGALSDSQRTTKTLREENAHLRERIQELEDELDALRDQLRHLANPVPAVTVRPLPQIARAPRGVHDRRMSASSPATVQGMLAPPGGAVPSLSLPSTSSSSSSSSSSSGRPPLQRSRSLLPASPLGGGSARSAAMGVDVDGDVDADVAVTVATGGRREKSPSWNPAFLDTLLLPRPLPLSKPQPQSWSRSRSRPHIERRASTTSSIFPSVPSNMSLLMLEEGVPYRETGTVSSTSISPPSPSRCLPTWTKGEFTGEESGGEDGIGGYCGHQSSPFMSATVDAMSPAAAEFSVVDIPGSPSSLHLRPEHELHLGDMASLSLYAMSDDEGQTYDL